MDLNLFFNRLSIPEQISQLFYGDNPPFKQFINMLANLWKAVYINMAIQADIKQKLSEIVIPHNRSQAEHHFWKLFLDRSCDIKWQDETMSKICDEGTKCYINNNSKDAMMLFGAYLEKLIAVSFNIDDCFSHYEIHLVREEKGKQTDLKIHNICSIHTAKIVISEYAKKLSSNDEAQLFPIIYPGLRFCDMAIKDYCRVKGNEIFRRQSRDVLEALNKCVEETVDGILDVRCFCPNVSPDTPDSLKGDQGERTVRCPDGKTFVFSYHVKPKATRIYYDTRYSPDRYILIGRILPIPQHPS